MNEAEALALANLIGQLLPLGISAYKQIQGLFADKLAPVETILASADASWDAVIAAAQKELGNQPPTP